MPWFYAHSGQQLGPVSDAEFERLAREGAIQPATLVWREGMQNWEPYASVARPQTVLISESGEAAPSTRQVVCRECGRSVPAEETMQLGDAVICSACKPLYVQKLREGALPPHVPHYGGFWIRVVAKIIDSLIVGLPVGILFLVLTLRSGYRNSLFNTAPTIEGILSSLGIQLGVQAVAIILNAFYTVWFVHKYSATPGKMVCGLRVVNADGSKLSLGRNFGRYGAELLSGLMCDLGYLVVAFDSQKRGLHDFICNTRVVYKR